MSVVSFPHAARVKRASGSPRTADEAPAPAEACTDVGHTQDVPHRYRLSFRGWFWLSYLAALVLTAWVIWR